MGSAAAVATSILRKSSAMSLGMRNIVSRVDLSRMMDFQSHVEDRDRKMASEMFQASVIQSVVGRARRH